jgi:hypothetical protein
MRGAPITVRCNCGEVQHVPYGDTWQCPSCHRRWNTNQISSEVYWGIMREMRDERVKVIIVALILAAGFAVFAATQGSRAWFLAPVVVAAWSLLYMPRWRRKLRAKARGLPRWNLHPD